MASEHEDELEEIDNIYYCTAIFISNHNKGIAKSLETHFPGNHLCICAFHIQQNVVQKYGQQVALDVLKIAKTFSRNQEEFFSKRPKRLRGQHTIIC